MKTTVRCRDNQDAAGVIGNEATRDVGVNVIGVDTCVEIPGNGELVRQAVVATGEARWIGAGRNFKIKGPPFVVAPARDADQVGRAAVPVKCAREVAELQPTPSLLQTRGVSKIVGQPAEPSKTSIIVLNVAMSHVLARNPPSTAAVNENQRSPDKAWRPQRAGGVLWSNVAKVVSCIGVIPRPTTKAFAQSLFGGPLRMVQQR